MKFDNLKHYLLTKISTKNPGRIIDGHWIAGVFEKSPSVGERMFMWRLANKDNPNGKLGYFSSSMIKEIIDGENFWIIKTLNSTYKLEEYKSDIIS